MLIKSELILNIYENQNGSSDPHCQPQQVQQGKELIPEGIPGQGKKVILE
jgi:hypothetical protein